jgi:hypothetical protein
MVCLFTMLKIYELYILAGAVILNLNNNKDDQWINDYQIQSK